MGKICVFFGHRNTFITPSHERHLEEIISDLIEKKEVNEFWLGGYSPFDSSATTLLHKLKKIYPHIQICFVFAYPPTLNKISWFDKNFDTFFCPNETKKYPQRFAIYYRNKYMASHCDYFVCLINHTYGGAYKTLKTAIQSKKSIINLNQGNL